MLYESTKKQICLRDENEDNLNILFLLKNKQWEATLEEQNW